MSHSLQVLEAANFDNHTFADSLNADLIALGFSVGAKVKVVRRFTVNFDKKDGGRKDVKAGEFVVLSGMAKGLPVVTVTKKIKDKDVEVKVSNEVSMACNLLLSK